MNGFDDADGHAETQGDEDLHREHSGISLSLRLSDQTTESDLGDNC